VKILLEEDPEFAKEIEEKTLASLEKAREEKRAIKEKSKKAPTITPNIEKPEESVPVKKAPTKKNGSLDILVED
jgi:sRNA-binding protein